MNYRKKSIIFALNTTQAEYGISGKGVMKGFFSHDFNAFKNNGETKTIYGEETFPSLVLKLMDNRNFNDASTEERKGMIYSDYYSEDAKNNKSVYLDDRRNLCQELHNKLCKMLSTPPTRVAFVSFSANDIDADLHYYCMDDGVLYIDGDTDYSEYAPTELAEQVIRGTFMHQMHYGTVKNFTSLDKLKGRERYLALSILMEQFLANSYRIEGKIQDRNDLIFNDFYSPANISSISNSYKLLDSVFRRYNLAKMKAVQPFYESCDAFFSTFTIPEDEESFDTEEFDEEFDENGLEVSTEAENYTTPEEMLEFDFDVLHEIGRTELNQNTNGFFKEFFLSELCKCAHKFYSDFDETFDEEQFAQQFNDYEELMEEYDEINDQIDSALNDEDEQ